MERILDKSRALKLPSHHCPSNSRRIMKSTSPTFVSVPLIMVALVSAMPRENVPHFSLKSWGSRSEIPTVDITFANGIKDTLVLHRHYASRDLERDGAFHCDFLGHLANEMEACVAMTGCPGEDDVSFTIFSKHNSGYAMYEWQKDGTVRGIDSPFKNGQASGDLIDVPETYQRLMMQRHGLTNPIEESKQSIPKPEAEPINQDQVLNSRMATIAEVNCGPFTGEDCENFPEGMKLQLKVFYTEALLNRVVSYDGTTVDQWINSVIVHTQAHFCLADSLGTRVKIEVIGIEYRPELDIVADVPGLNAVKASAIADNSGADLYSYFTDDKIENGTIGIAWSPVVCSPFSEHKELKTSIIEHRTSNAENAWVTAHELAHNLAMRHDFDAFNTEHPDSTHYDLYRDHAGHVHNLNTHYAQGCNNSTLEGIMDYGVGLIKWSPCSAFDFLQWRRLLAEYGYPWCMETLSAEEACGAGSSSTPTTGCGAPAWKGDTYCDDQNNNEACEWDGGDCCDLPQSNWNYYCDECECLEPCEGNILEIGDGICNDELNTQSCDFDGGDCCVGMADPEFCEDCVCKTPCEKMYVGDDFCDDINNHLWCGFDGGDCCNNSNDNWNKYCEDCECLNG